MSTAADRIKKSADVLFEEGQVAELRALGVPEEWADKGFTHSGYFDDFEELASSALRLDRKGAKGVYVTPNPVDPDLLGRANNRAVRGPKSTTTNDEITRRRWLLIDGDPQRPAGIASTDEELEAARTRLIEVGRFLKDEGFPGGVLAESGNGAHLLYRVDLPADDDGLTKRILEALDERFTDEAVEIDPGVHNAARIWKLYGTTARKGDATEKRPHRRAKILRVADPLEAVPRSTLEAVAVEKPPKAGQTSSPNHQSAAPESGDPGPSEDRPQGLPTPEVRRVLGCIPPRPDYNDWYRVAAGVYDAVGGDLDTAVRLLKEWSPEETEGEYRKKAPDFDDITTGTLVRMAKGHGYVPPSKRNGRTPGASHAGSPGSDREGDVEGVPEIGTRVSGVQRERIRWLWKGRLALGELTMLDGDPGLGKSTLLLHLAARLSTGRPMPGEEGKPTGEPTGAVIVTTEDSIGHTIRPRLEAAGADLDRVKVVQTVPTRADDGSWDGPERVPTLPDDLPLLRRACEDVDAPPFL